MEVVSKVFFRRSNPRYSFVPAGLEHGRVSVDHLQILQLPHDGQADCASGDFGYTAHMIAEIRFQKFRCFSAQVPVQWKNRIQTSGLPFCHRVKIGTQDDKCDLQSVEWNR